MISFYLKLIIRIIMFISFFIPLKLLANENLKFSPYVGVDVQQRYTSFKKSFGDSLFKKNSPQGNVYFGCKLNEYFGFELGYQATGKKDQDILVQAGTIHLGQIAHEDWLGIGSKKIQGWNCNLIGFIPFSDEYNFCLMGIVGASQLKLKLKDIRVDTSKTVYNHIVFNHRKNIPRIGAGIQKVLGHQFIVRATVIWENTAKFNNISRTGFNGTTYTIKLKNSTIYGLGMGIIF